MKPITLQDLQKFCIRDEARYELTHPFTVGDYTYATDGRIAIRVPALPEADATPKKTNPTSIFADDPATYTPIELPPGWQEFPQLTKICADCKGVGKCPERIECDECCGSGEAECPTCHQDHDCPECQGKGDVRGDPNATCEACRGDKFIEVMTTISGNRGEIFFSDVYLRRIHTLPDVALSHKLDNPSLPAAFVFTGGEGRVMPLRMPTTATELVATQWPA